MVTLTMKLKVMLMAMLKVDFRDGRNLTEASPCLARPLLDLREEFPSQVTAFAVSRREECREEGMLRAEDSRLSTKTESLLRLESELETAQPVDRQSQFSFEPQISCFYLIVELITFDLTATMLLTAPNLANFLPS